MLFYLFSHEIQVDVWQHTFSWQNGLSQTQGPSMNFLISGKGGFLAIFTSLFPFTYAFFISS